MQTGQQEFDPARFAQQRVEEAGVFRCAPFDWTVEDHSKAANPEKGTDATHSHALVLRFLVGKKWHPEDQGAWSNRWPEGWFVEVRVWIIGKDGNINEKAVKNLSDCGIWKGDLEELEGRPPKVWCLVTVEEEEYQGKPQFRGNWINEDAERPAGRGQFKPMSPENMTSLRARFGGKLKSIGGGKPAGGPASPAAGGAVPGGPTPGGPATTTPTPAATETPTPAAAAAPAAAATPTPAADTAVNDGPMPSDSPGGPIDVDDDDLPF